MTTQWYELKRFLKDKIEKNDWPFSSIPFEMMLIKMNEIESKHACQSLKEAGY